MVWGSWDPVCGFAAALEIGIHLIRRILVLVGEGGTSSPMGAEDRKKGHGVVCQEGSPKSPKQGVSRVTFRM